MIRRTKTLVVFNTFAGGPPAYPPHLTSDGYTSKQCADAYADARGYCADGITGHYWNLGVDFGGISHDRAYSDQTAAALNTLTVTSSYSPGQTPEVNNTRYYGQALVTAIRNMVDDGELDAIFTESLVPNHMPQCAYSGHAHTPDGWFMGLCPLISRTPTWPLGVRWPVYGTTDLFDDSAHTLPDPTLNKWIVNNRDTHLPYGRIGWAGCSFADIQRVAADANWGESQNNLPKPHLIGGTNYVVSGAPNAGGVTARMNRAHASFDAHIRSGNLNALNEDGSFPSGIDWTNFINGTLSPQLNLFGAMWSKLPAMDLPNYHTLPAGGTLCMGSWQPIRGAWVFNWCSGALNVGYANLRSGGTASILCEDEPYVGGLPATDCVADALMRGLSMAEANFLASDLTRASTSVYGAPDYSPYRATNAVTGDELDMAHPTFIAGLELKWVSGNQIDLGIGAAYVQSVGDAVDVPAPVNITGISLGADVWGYVYLKNDGTAECVTTAPAAPYAGFARSKTGANTHRFVGAVRSDTYGHLVQFKHFTATGQVNYLNRCLQVAPFRVLSNGAATTGTAVDASSCIPPQSRAGYIHIANYNPAYHVAYVGSNDYTASSANYEILANMGVDTMGLCVCDSSQRVNYAVSGSGGGLYIDVHGFVLER